MAYRKHRHGEIQPGDVAQSETDSTYLDSPDTMAYPGFIPPAYQRPTLPRTQSDGGGHDAVPTNTDRGTESHGVQLDSHVGPKDSLRAVGELTEKSDRSPLEMPEADDRQEYPPIKVEVVNQDPDEITRITTTTVTIIPSANTASGSAAATGMTPIRVLGKDPHRTKAFLFLVSFTSGGLAANGVASQAVVIASENQPPVYGFPLGTARMEIYATDEVWVAGQNIADAGIIAVYAERTTNADRLYGD